MEDNDGQWLERALTREKESLEVGSEVIRELFKQYDQAGQEIRISVNDFLVRYEHEQGSANDKAAKSLNMAEMKEWKDSVDDWAKRINEEKDAAAKQLLQSRLKMVKCIASPSTRLELLSGQMGIVLDDLSAKNVRQMWNVFEALYSEAYYKKIFDIEQRYGSLREFKKLDSEMNDVLSYPWNGVNFVDRMAENIKMLYFQMQKKVTQGLRHGKGSKELSKELSDQLGASFKNIEILVRGESAYFHNEAIRSAYEAAGVKQYEYVAKLDRRTSDTCLSLDGQKFNVADAQRRINYPPMHPRCRSTTIEVADGMDESRLGDEPLPKDMTYEQWYMERVEGMSNKLPEFNPLSNPKIEKEIESNPSAVYGYSPKKGSPLDKFGVDWTNHEQVAAARAKRQEYLQNMEKKKIKLENEVAELKGKGMLIEDIARMMVEKRNTDRMQSYIDNNDFEALEAMKERNIQQYGRAEGPTPDKLFEKYGSWEELIYSSIRTSPAMDVLTGLYKQ